MIRILDKNKVKELMDIAMAVEAVETAYKEKATGAGQIWPMVFHEFDPGHADLDIKSGNLDGEQIFGLKLVSWYGDNPEQGHPALYGTSMIFDLATGQPKAILNAGPMTDYRTGAAGAVGAKYLARPDAKQLLMVGCGALAPYLLAAALYVMPELERVCLVNPHHPERAKERLAAIAEKTDLLLQEVGVTRTAELTASEAIEEETKKSDIIFTATPSYEPMIQPEWVKPGTHISCVGADISGKQEIASGIFAKAKVFGDDEGQCISVGECEKPYKEGIMKGLDAELGAIIAGEKQGRTNPDDITIFDSTGIALQDLASAAKVIAKAEKENIGVCIEL